MKYLRQIIQDLKKMPLIVAVSIGAVLRAQVVLKSDFPINDGGMFFVMIRDLLANGFKLPLYTSYNSSFIPFTYPPIPFYIAAFIHKVFEIEIVQLLRVIPLINSIITIPFFYLLSKNLYPKRSAIFATLVFAILPRSFEWQIMGGGLTRSFGFLFSIISLYFFSSQTKNLKRFLLLGSLFLALTFLSHFEWFAFATGSLILLTLFKKVGWGNFLRAILVTTILILPWFILITSRFGVGPFSSFFQAGVALKNTLVYTQVLFLQITDEYFLSVFGVLTVVGAFIQMARKDKLVIVWLIAPLLLAQRSAPNLTAVPISILSGTAISEISLLLKKINKNSILNVSNAFLFFVFSYSILNTVSLVYIKYNYYYYDSLTPDQRSDISTASGKIPSSECVLVLTNKTEGAWGVDSLSEWFPALTGLKSPITAQGSEWLPDDTFNRKIHYYHDVKACFNKGLGCLADVEEKNNSYCNYIYLEKPELDSFSTALIQKELDESKEYQLTFTGETASVYKGSRSNETR